MYEAVALFCMIKRKKESFWGHHASLIFLVPSSYFSTFEMVLFIEHLNAVGHSHISWCFQIRNGFELEKSQQTFDSLDYYTVYLEISR